MKIPLFESQSAVAGADGTATVRFFPGTAGSSWKIERMVTSIPGATPDTIVNLVVYRNVISEANRLDGTQSAAQDTSELPNPIDVPASDTIVGYYTGVTPGLRCNLTLTGTKETGRI